MKKFVPSFGMIYQNGSIKPFAVNFENLLSMEDINYNQPGFGVGFGVDPTSTSIFGGLTSLLTCLFIGLKLANVISWSWVWVLSPLWISFLVFVLSFVFCLVVYFYMMRKNRG